MATVRKVFRQNKGVFQDFINSGSEYKVAVFFLLNRIYIEEIIPEEMRKTTLTKTLFISSIRTSSSLSVSPNPAVSTTYNDE